MRLAGASSAPSSAHGCSRDEATQSKLPSSSEYTIPTAARPARGAAHTECTRTPPRSASTSAADRASRHGGEGCGEGGGDGDGGGGGGRSWAAAAAAAAAAACSAAAAAATSSWVSLIPSSRSGCTMRSGTEAARLAMPTPTPPLPPALPLPPAPPLGSSAGVVHRYEPRSKGSSRAGTAGASPKTHASASCEATPLARTRTTVPPALGPNVGSADVSARRGRWMSNRIGGAAEGTTLHEKRKLGSERCTSSGARGS